MATAEWKKPRRVQISHCERFDKRLDAYLDLDAELIRQPNPLPMLH
jgi:hypothetical protein